MAENAQDNRRFLTASVLEGQNFTQFVAPLVGRFVGIYGME